MLPFLALAASLAEQAGPPAAPPPPCPRSAIFIAEICQSSNFARYLEGAQRELRRRDRDGDGLDADDIELLRLRRRAAERADSLKTILVYDLDGDFSVDRSEMERAVPTDFFNNDGYPSSNAEALRHRLFSTYDADRDGRIERDEVLNAPLPQGNLELLEGLRATLALDPNGDGRLDEGELAAVARSAFDAVDSDRDDFISQAEFAVALEQWVGRRRRGPVDGYDNRLCAMPAVPEEATLVHYSSYSGGVALPGDLTGATPGTAIDVQIEAGIRPLYLILTSFQPIVWRFSGEVGRVERVVVDWSARNAEARNGSQAVGLAAERVTVIREGCLDGYADLSRDNASLPIQIWRSAGRRPDVMASTYSPVSVSLPSGRIVERLPAR